MTFHQNSLLTYFHSNQHPPPAMSSASPELPLHQHSSQDVNMSQKPDDRPSKPRSWSVQSATTDGTEGSRPMKSQPGKRSKHSWEYVVVDPAEHEAPPSNASRLEKELHSSFTNNFLGPRARRTRAGAGSSQPFHYKDGSETSNTNTASESAFSSNRSNSAVSPASSPAPPSGPATSRKRKDSVAPVNDVAPPRKRSKGFDHHPIRQPSAHNGVHAASRPANRSASPPQQKISSASELSSASLLSGSGDAPRHVTSKDLTPTRQSAVFDDASRKMSKTFKKTDSNTSPKMGYNSEPPDKRKRAASPSSANKEMPKSKKAKTGPATAVKPQAKPASQQQHAQKRDSLLEENLHAHNKQPHHRQALQQSNQQNQASGSKTWKKQAQTYYPHSPTRAELAEQLEEITHRGIAGGPCNYSSLSEYRAACAAEAAWQERDQQVVEHMLDNPHVVSVLKRLRELDDEIEAERRASVAAVKAAAKGGGKGKGGAKKKGGNANAVSTGIGDR